MTPNESFDVFFFQISYSVNKSAYLHFDEYKSKNMGYLNDSQPAQRWMGEKKELKSVAAFYRFRYDDCTCAPAARKTKSSSLILSSPSNWF